MGILRHMDQICQQENVRFGSKKSKIILPGSMHVSRIWRNFKYMSQEDNKSLNVVIGGINLRVRPKESEQAQIEKIVAEINARLKDIQDRKSTRLNSSHVATSYAVFC